MEGIILIESKSIKIWYRNKDQADELELVRTHIIYITLNTAFPYICKQCEPFYIIKVCQEPSCKINTL